ncbi:hypothetical protein ACHAPJ_004784 [Fusarium lateritium]
MPTLDDKKLAEIAVPTEDLPVTPQKRKRGIQEQDNKHRRARATAWLSVHMNAQGFSFEPLWRDNMSSAVNSKFVQLNEGWTMKKAIKKSILNWDTQERDRVEWYNTRMVVALARMRIHRFAQAGTEILPVVPHHLRVNERTLKCDLVSDRFGEMTTLMTEINDDLRRMNPGAPSNIM